MNEIGLNLEKHIRTIPDWPQKGVMFRDISSLLEARLVFRKLVDLFVHRYFTTAIDAVVGIDARGFIIGAPLAYELNAGFIPVRKKGKLPGRTISEAYTLEYGEAEVEIQTDWLQPGYQVILVDDLIATGGTMLAAATLLNASGLRSSRRRPSSTCRISAAAGGCGMPAWQSILSVHLWGSDQAISGNRFRS